MVHLRRGRVRLRIRVRVRVGVGVGVGGSRWHLVHEAVERGVAVQPPG